MDRYRISLIAVCFEKVPATREPTSGSLSGSERRIRLIIFLVLIDAAKSEVQV
jgi:hypothetical protein